MSIKEFTNEELKEELEKRKSIIPIMKPQEEASNDLYASLKVMVKEHVKAYMEDPESENDYDHYIWEKVMEAFYGEDFFDWWNSLC